jgi:hypothetical protein
MGILSGFTIKDALYGAVILALGIFLWHYHTLQNEVDTAKVVAASAKQVVQVDQSAAKATETRNADVVKQAVSAPPVANLGVVCERAGGGQVPAANPVAAAPTREQPADGPVGPAFDPSGALLTRAALADAQISYLQARIHELETEMNNAP